MRVAFTTLGCKINQFDTDRMRSDLVSSGGTVVPFDEEADVYIINTCSVTAKSDYQCRQAIRAAVRKGKGAKVVVTGCYAQTRPGDIHRIPGVDLVVGNSGKDTIKEQIFSLIHSTPGEAASNPESAVLLPGGRTRGFLKIQDGCDNRCTYCIVPQARGSSRSIPPESVHRMFRELAGNGCPEAVLSGVHIGMYGRDLEPQRDLTGILHELLAERGTTRLRLSSIEPRELTDGIIDRLGKGICRHLHIPLQSGDDGVLAAMNREYTSGFYRDLLERISERVPGIALGADVMVGFPGEGEKEFLNTCRLVEESPISHLHVFSYSPRPGTSAAKMQGQVPEPVKKMRNGVLRRLGRGKLIDFSRRFIREKLSVVIEDKTDATTGCLTGLSDNYIRVAVRDAGPDDIGKALPVEITRVDEDVVSGVLSRENRRD